MKGESMTDEIRLIISKLEELKANAVEDANDPVLHHFASGRVSGLSQAIEIIEKMSK